MYFKNFNKKVWLILIQSCIMMFVCFLSTGCAQKDIPAYMSFRGQDKQLLFQQAQSFLRQNKYAEAIERLEAFNAFYPWGPLSKKVQWYLIYAYYQHDDLASALSATEHYLHVYPGDQHADYAYFMRGMIYYHQGESWIQKMWLSNAERRDLSHLKSAFSAFRFLTHEFPQSAYFNTARQYMIYIRELIAHHDMLVAQFYEQHHAYVAAANRAVDIVAYFQGTPFVKPALMLLHRTYLRWGEKQLASDVEHILSLSVSASHATEVTQMR